MAPTTTRSRSPPRSRSRATTTSCCCGRGFEPGKGLWTFPGGFVDLGESVEDAARREAQEEIRAEVHLQRLVGVYSRDTERVVLIVFAARIETEPQTTPEATEIRAFAPHDIPWDELAFWSTTNALRDFLDERIP